MALGFPGSSAGKESSCNAGNPGSIPGSGRPAREGIGYPLLYSWTSLVAQLVKKGPAMWETWVLPLSWEDSLEKELANPLQYSDLENSMNCMGSQSWSQLSNCHFPGGTSGKEPAC